MKSFERFKASTVIGFMLGLTVLEIVALSIFHVLWSEILWLLVVNALIAALAIYQSRAFRISRSALISEINQKASGSLNSTLSEMPIGLISYDAKTYEPDWYNPYIEFIFNDAAHPISADKIHEILDSHEKDASAPLVVADKKYQITVETKKHLIYLADATAEFSAKSSLSARRPILGVISVDNYDDATDGLSDGEISTINSVIVNFLDKFASENQIFFRRLSSDRFIFFANYRVLKQQMDTRFQLLTQFRELTAEKGTPLSLSIGISYGVNDFASMGKMATSNLELAQVRGGDQVVIKENEPAARAFYFGGNSESRMTKTRTRARAIATALKTVISESDQVFIVGHRLTDMDALGAAIAMKNFVAMNGKEAFVVYDKDELLPDVARAIEALNKEDEKLYAHILRLETAQAKKLSKDLLIMVDHSKVAQTLSKNFYDSFEKVVVIDHHRRDAEDFAEKAILTFIESGASSASEMAVEVLQFQDTRRQKMTAIEASVILAGISLDTKSFSKVTTSKTFEAAAYLRNQGADNDVVARLLATDFEDYKRVNQIVVSAQVVHAHIAIALGSPDETYNRVTLAKASDALLLMNGITTAFTIGKTAPGRIAISARNRDAINVQRIMENMGGGGHFESAATEIENQTLAEVQKTLLIQLNDLLTEKENTQ
ncbi:MAG: DHH family phosphoesterase [Streptococcaceae bacterium]|jgi:c-di-AMP phosphodiesterase-like protein|nr:DHH family phosphoesterase [Streptococcaceae bacterium]